MRFSFSSLLYLTLASTLSASISNNGLIDYFDANTGIIDSVGDGSGHITGWTNQGPSLSHVTIADPQASLTQGVHGQKMVRFSNQGNVDAGLNFSQTGSLSQGYSLIAVVRIDRDSQGHTSNQYILRDLDGEQSLKCHSSISLNSSIDGSNNVLSTSFFSYLQSKDTFILTTTVTPTTRRLYIDGHLVSEQTTSGTSIDFTNAPTWEIGKSLVGDLGSLLIYDSSATLQDLHQTGLELANQYDLHYGQRLYVDSDTFSPGDGSSWSSPFQSLSTAIAAASSPSQIWIRKGIYTPPANGAFELKNGVSLIGGFETNTTSASARDPRRYRTVLSGDIDGDDDRYFGSITRDGVLTTVLSASRGQGEFNGNFPHGVTLTFKGQNANPIVRSHFTDQTAKLSGVVLTAGETAFINTGGSPILSDCSFIGNKAAIANFYFDYDTGQSQASSLRLQNCLIAGNFESQNGVLYNAAELIAYNCSFTGNAAGAHDSHYYSGEGGAFYNDGSAILTNCTFTGNYAQEEGGAIYHAYGNGPHTPHPSSLLIQNCIIWNNLAKQSSQAPSHSIKSVGPNLTVKSSLIQYSGGSTSWDSRLGVDGGNNLDLDPQFFESIDPHKAPLYITEHQLSSHSPAIGVADANLTIDGSSLKIGEISHDICGNPRLIDRDQDGSARLDLGAYEVPTPMHVTSSGSSSSLGPSWDSPTHLDNALLLAKFGQEIWLANGSHSLSGYVAMPNGAKLLGGFEGTETTSADRDFQNNTSTIAGGVFPYIDNCGETTLIDGVTFSSNYATLVVEASGQLRDCTITNSQGVAFYGDSDALFLRCKITNNSRAGVTLSGSHEASPSFIECVITGNHNPNSQGGGFRILSGTVLASHCTIAGNLASGPQGGSGVYDGGDGSSFRNSIIWQNYDGISSYSSEVRDTNNSDFTGTIVGNFIANNSFPYDDEGAGPQVGEPNPLYTSISIFENAYDVTSAPILNFNYALAADTLVRAINNDTGGTPPLLENRYHYAYGDIAHDLAFFQKPIGTFHIYGDDSLADSGAVQYQDPIFVDSDNDGLSNAFEMTYSGGSTTALLASQDIDKDGLTNLVEFALGSDPTTPDILHAFSPGSTGNYATITFHRNNNATDFTQIFVERSTDLGINDPWTTDLTIQSSVSPIDSNTDTITHRSIYPSSNQKKEFLRLRIEKK